MTAASYVRECPIPAALLDDGGQIVEANDALRGLLGLEGSAVERSRLSTLLADADAPRVERLLQQLCSGQRRHAQAEAGVRTASGQILPVTLSVWVAAETEGCAAGVLVQFQQDINEERRRAQEELRRRDERHRAFLTTSSEGIWRCELDTPVPTVWPVDRQVEAFFAHGYLAECNDAMARMYGFDGAHELVGARINELLVPTEPSNIAYLREFVASGYRLSGRESHEVDRYGRVRYFRNSLVGIVEGDVIVRAWGTQTDVTDQKQSEILLRESEARFRMMADHAPVLMWLTDASNLSTFFNRPWLEFTGAPLEAQTGTGWLDFVHPDDRASASAQFTSHVERRLPFDMEFRLRRHDGEYRWVLDYGTPLVDAEGGFTGYIGACVDITPMKAARDREAFLVRTGKVLVSSLDYRDTLTQAAALTTPFLADWCAIDIVRDEGAFERVGAAGSVPSSADLTPLLSRAVRARRALMFHRVGSGRTDGAGDPEATFEATLSALGARSAVVAPFVARDRVLGVMTLAFVESDRLYDDSDLRLVERIATRAAMVIDNASLFEEAQTANRAKDDFLARLSHELRTPLNAVMGWAQMLRTNSSPAQLERGLTVLDRNARALARIIEDLLDFSRNVRGALRIEPAPIELRDVVHQAIGSVETFASEKQVSVTFAAGEPVELVGDPARLQQVVWNLLTNAIKFTPAGGCVSVVVGDAGENALLTVSDTGSGIPDDLLERIFDPFRQGVVAGTGGLGLGLAIVRQIVEAHGGSVSASNLPHGGARFSVRLPREQTAAV